MKLSPLVQGKKKNYVSFLDIQIIASGLIFLNIHYALMCILQVFEKKSYLTLFRAVYNVKNITNKIVNLKRH